MPIKPLNILLVDDDKGEESFFNEALNSLEFTFNLLFSTGRDTIDNELKKKPDLIFLDINMKQGSGIQLLQQIKSHPEYKHIPVIMYSVSVRTDDIEASYKHGAHYYLVKPYAHLNFTHALKTVFKTDWTQPQSRPTLDGFVINLAFA